MLNVLITGATSGIGLACVRRFTEQGWRVICVGRNQRRLDESVRIACEFGEQHAFGICADLGESGVTKTIFQNYASQIGPLHALVNSAAIATLGECQNISDNDWEELFRVNVTASFAMIRDALPLLQQAESPAVVNVSSIAGRFRSISLNCAYSASKAAVIGMTKHLACELGPQGIRVNCVCPSQTLTPMLIKALSIEKQTALANSIPLRRLAKPEEQAAVIYFLCTPDASYVNGAIFDVNGGIF